MENKYVCLQFYKKSNKKLQITNFHCFCNHKTIIIFVTGQSWGKKGKKQKQFEIHSSIN